MRVATVLLIVYLVACAASQTLPDGASAVPFDCPAPENLREPRNESERLEFERRARYRAIFPAYLAAVPEQPDAELLMPVDGVRVSQVADTWGAPRGGGRSHEGQDIFAPRGTSVRSVVPGYVYRVGESRLGGNVVVVVGGGGRRYYYAHLHGFADVREGQRVEQGDLLGYVGTTGNAAGTPPHLHFGVYVGDANPCAWHAVDPLPLLVDR
ncbi:MAG: M23 family metallopeptidase [Trueperaceae bacterium]|nr:MAG: M23 family metallopeptidase [Trueperaceae bacterium]